MSELRELRRGNYGTTPLNSLPPCRARRTGGTITSTPLPDVTCPTRVRYARCLAGNDTPDAAMAAGFSFDIRALDV